MSFWNLYLPPVPIPSTSPYEMLFNDGSRRQFENEAAYLEALQELDEFERPLLVKRPEMPEFEVPGDKELEVKAFQKKDAEPDFGKWFTTIATVLSLPFMIFILFETGDVKFFIGGAIVYAMAFNRVSIYLLSRYLPTKGISLLREYYLSKWKPVKRRDNLLLYMIPFAIPIILLVIFGFLGTQISDFTASIHPLLEALWEVFTYSSLELGFLLVVSLIILMFLLEEFISPWMILLIYVSISWFVNGMWFSDSTVNEGATIGLMGLLITYIILHLKFPGYRPAIEFFPLLSYFLVVLAKIIIEQLPGLGIQQIGIGVGMGLLIGLLVNKERFLVHLQELSRKREEELLEKFSDISAQVDSSPIG
ncbi:MAG: hypothetical protein AAFY71_08425 [Bacteroidota bacterium]